MAKLVAVCRSDDFRFERRQLPLEIEDCPKMVIQFKDTCIGCETTNMKQGDLQRFVQRFSKLTKEEISSALMVTSRDLLSLLAQTVPCVGCRRSVETLFQELRKCGHPALDPLTVNKQGVLSISYNYLYDPKAIYALFYLHGSKLNTLMEAIPKSKKNKRCQLHSLENHKSKSSSNWMDTWELLSQECREECVLIDTDSLVLTLDIYLRKHRFCSECKSKVQRAFNILIGDIDSLTEKGFCPALYDGLQCCPHEKHLHVLCETDYIGHLIGRAEPELLGSRRERHAKTLDIAQEEVLTCLGVHLYERLHRISQKMKSEEQTWQVLFFLGVDALKKGFEVALERKQGITNLELWCEELMEEERVKEHKKEQKKKKKKKKKMPKPAFSSEMRDELENKENQADCQCVEVPTMNAIHSCTASIDVDSKSSCDCHLKPSIMQCDRFTTCTCVENTTPSPPSEVSRCHCDYDCCSNVPGPSVLSSSKIDCGYSSGPDVCDGCSAPSSEDGSEDACSDGVCNYEIDTGLCSCSDECGHSMLRTSHVSLESSYSNKIDSPSRLVDQEAQSKGQFGMLSLQGMLEASRLEDDTDTMISEEEIQHFRANQKRLDTQRQQLRETLRKRFDCMKQKEARCHEDCDCVNSGC